MENKLLDLVLKFANSAFINVNTVHSNPISSKRQGQP